MVKNNVDPDIIIFGAHQSYVNSFAGGYIRLREFLQYIPKGVTYRIIDLYPSIYTDIVPSNRIISCVMPAITTFFLTYFFPLGVLLERIATAYQTYIRAKVIIKTTRTSILYIPTAELLHLYLPAILLKREFPHIKVVVDILNFEIIECSFFALLKKYSNNTSFITAFAITAIHFISYRCVKSTINLCDYVFTVSPELVTTIKKIYKKDTIDYTPSGVSRMLVTISEKKKKYTGIYVGRVTEQKGVFNIIKVWEKIHDVNPKARLAIVGIISKEMQVVLQAKLEGKRLLAVVDVIGSVTEEEKSKYLSESTVFLHLANYEPLFPVIGILEACSHGLPVIAFTMPVVDSQKDLEKYKSITIIENSNYSKVTAAIQKIVHLTPNEKNDLAKNAKLFANKYKWSKIAKKEWDIITALIAG